MIKADEIGNIIYELEQYNRGLKIANIGIILQVGNNITHIYSFDEVVVGELVEFKEGTIGITLNLELNNVDVVLKGDNLMIQEESFVKATKKKKTFAQILVRKAYLGCVVNALPKPINGQEAKFQLLNLD